MEINWQEDGGVPHSFTMWDASILACDTVEDAIELVEREIMDDFLEKVEPVYDLDEIKQQVEELFANRKEEVEDE